MTDKEFLDQFMPWIAKWANKCQHISKYIDFDDLQSVGMMAAFEGRDTFKEGKNTKLNTHIMNMVKFRILRHANSGKEYLLSQNNHILAIQKARRILGEEATPEEISEWMKGHYSDRASMLIPSTIRDLERVASTKHTSIQALQDAEGIQPDRYMPTTIVDYESDLDEKLKMEQLELDISELNEFAQIVVKGRLANKTLDDIAKEINRTRERVRQIEAKAIRDLRVMKNRRELRNESYITTRRSGHREDVLPSYGVLRGSSDERQSRESRPTPDSSHETRDEPIPELEPEDRTMESEDLEVLLIGESRNEEPQSELHIRPLLDDCSNSSTSLCNHEPSRLNGVTFKHHTYGDVEVLNDLPCGTRYEVLILDLGKHVILKTEEIPNE